MAIDRDKVLQSAQKLVDKKRFDKAILEYRKVIADDPSDVRTLLKIGDLHLKLDQYEDAIGTYEQVGEFYYREGFSVKAIAVYKQIRGIIRRHASHLEGRYGHIVPRLAEIYTQLGLTSDALAAYDEVATRLRQEGRERDALDIFKKVVELDPQNPIAYLRVADSHARLGDMEEAVGAFGEAAEIMLKLGRLDDALKVLERLLEYRQDPKYARIAGETYLQRGGPNDGMAALTKLQIAFKANPKDLETLAVLAQAFDAIGQPKKAVEVLKEAARVAREGDTETFAGLVQTLVERAPRDPVVQTLRGQLAQRRAADESVEIRVEEEAISERHLEPDWAPGEGAPGVGARPSLPHANLEESIDEVFELTDGDVVAVPDSSDALFAPQSLREGSAVTRLVKEAERHRLGGQLDHAIRVLRDGLRNLGSSRQLRHRLSDLLLEAGDRAGGLREKLILAHELATEGDTRRAVHMLDSVLQLQPGQPDALRMKQALGGSHAAPVPQARPSRDVPLQSYDIESGGVDEALQRGSGGQQPAGRAPAGRAPAGGARLDDPFAPGQSPAQMPPVQMPVQMQQGFAMGAAPPMAIVSLPSGYPQERPSLDEGALDRAEAMAEQGRFDEARAILHQQLRHLPNHPLVVDRLADIDALAAHAMAQAAARYPSDPGGYPPAPGPPAVPDHLQPEPYVPDAREQQPSYAGFQAPDSHGRYYDEPEPEPVPEPVPEPSLSHQPAHQPAHEPVTADQEPDPYDELGGIMDQVRKGVKNQVSDADTQTHYDLGVAYMEMGLHQDAISALTLASRDPMRECVCLSMIGTIHLHSGDIDSALDAMQRALSAGHKTRDQEMALGYEIANTYELKGMTHQALQYFDWVAKLEPNYDDPRGSLRERIYHIRGGSGAQRRPGPPQSGPSADYDQQYDDIYRKN